MYDDTKLNVPLKKIEEKWKLVPAFLRLRGLVKQHIDSFNYFLNVEMRRIVTAEDNCTITSDHPSYRDYFIEFTDIYVGNPVIKDEQGYHNLTPNECRIRDMTYSAPIFVDVKYTRGNSICVQPKVCIGRMPIMLGSSKCWLTGMNHEELAKIRECPFDPKGYFIIKGSEKVVLI